MKNKMEEDSILDYYYDATCRFRTYYGYPPEVAFMTKKTLEELEKKLNRDYSLKVPFKDSRFLGMKIILTEDFHGVGYKIESICYPKKK